MSTHNIHLKYRTPKRYPIIISIVPPGVALIVTFRGSNYRCLEQIFMVPKGFEPSKFDCILTLLAYIANGISVIYSATNHWAEVCNAIWRCLDVILTLC